MKHTTVYVTALLGTIIFIGALVFWSNDILAPKAEAVESSIVDLKDGDEYDLTASYVKKDIGGRSQTMLAYNGSIPGPTIRVPQGAEITIRFTNGTDIPALLHSHGVRMDNAFDGSQSVQTEMRPGETFAYKLKFPDAGVYWYHPHVKEVFGQGRGLYGAFIVTPSDLGYFPPVNREVPIFLSDIPIVNGTVDLDKNATTNALMGHYGNVMLVNGSEDFELRAKAGEVVRLYFINAANVRPFNVSIEGLKLKRIGGDSGAYEKAVLVDSVILSPSERVIIDARMPSAGVYEIKHTTPYGTQSLGTIRVEDEKINISYAKEFETLQTNGATVRSIDLFREFFDRAPDKRISLSLTMGGGFMSAMGGHRMPDGTIMGGRIAGGNGAGISEQSGIEWEDTNQMMNAMSNNDLIAWNIRDQDTGNENDRIKWIFNREEPLKIRIFNDPQSMHPMQHPIHFHGQRFLVVARDGVKQSNLVWKDTVLVRSGETVDIILDPSNPGIWMAHCHISEHLEAGMMFTFTVE